MPTSARSLRSQARETEAQPLGQRNGGKNRVKVIVETDKSDDRRKVDRLIQEISKLGVEVRVGNYKLACGAAVKAWLYVQLNKQESMIKDPSWPFV